MPDDRRKKSRARKPAAPKRSAAKKPAANKPAGTKAASKTRSTAKSPGTKSSAKSPVTKSTSTKSASKRGASVPDQSASQRIDRRIAELGGWRGETLARLRSLIAQAVPDVVEEWKWEVPVWSRDGIICTGEAYKSVVKMTFPKGASLADPARLFNSSLEGSARRAIDIREGERIDEPALQALIRAAATLNAARR